MVYFARARRRYLGCAAGLIAGVDFFCTSTINFSETQIRSGLGLTSEEFVWVLTAYAVAGALSILALERLSRVLRYRTLLLAGLALFAIGSLAAALSENLPELVAARALQGLGGGPLLTCTRILLQVAVPPERRAGQMKGFILCIFISAAPGPWLAARTMLSGDWHALFGLQVLEGAFAAVVAWAMVPPGAHSTREVGHLDPGALLAFCLGIMIWMSTLQSLHDQPLASGQALLLLTALGLFAWLAWSLHRHPDPWLRLQTLNSRRYLVGLGFYTLYYVINGAMTLLLPKNLLIGEGFDLLSSGRMLSLGGCATVAALPLYWKFLAPGLRDRRRLMACGFVLFAGLCWAFSHYASPGIALEQLLPLFVLKGWFPVLVVIQVAGLSFHEFKQADFAHAYALKNVLRLMANAVGAGWVVVYWQTLTAQSRTVLVARVDGLTPGVASDVATLNRLSQAIDQQAALLCSAQIYLAIALLCVLGAVLVLWQRALR